MKPEYAFHIRVTGILMENDQLLLVRQKVNEREWSLPGGRLEQGESLAQGMLREMKEETGLDTAIERMLYVCDIASSDNTALHITFLLKRTGGTITLPTNEFDQNPIHEVRFVPVDELRNLGFSEDFVRLIQLGFPQAGSYMGDKTQIGL